MRGGGETSEARKGRRVGDGERGTAELISVPRKEGGEKARAGVEEDEDAVAGGMEGVPIYTSILNLLR
jgi:hypothetical protein